MALCHLLRFREDGCADGRGATAAYFKALTRHLSGQTETEDETRIEDFRSWPGNPLKPKLV
jgi:hypothetical protein